ncbi:metal ABC transporter ATP-binding protein [Sabulicella rubraurantiaca]|uniref:metal ABC transporter ATP-binding protein n=1 Tax=Sabulicella rubraurantiaca TaxID=2811429 RepID=UPI001A9733C9|nr:ABC transporter ATP-binding protein [Sabulicella rubraurantiaca]
MSLAVRNLTVSHDRRPAVHHLSFTLRKGGLMAVVGPNGAGKSTLLRAIAGLHPPAEGEVVAEGRVALLPQQAGLDRTFPFSCREAVMLGLWAECGSFGRISEEGRVLRALEAVGLHGFAGRPVGSLSTGQFQRLLFARLLLQDAPVILLDEPFNALDARTAADLLALVRRWHGEGRTILAVLHDLDLVREEFPETLLLAREAVAVGPTQEALSSANRLRARRMAEGWDPHAEPCARAA